MHDAPPTRQDSTIHTPGDRSNVIVRTYRDEDFHDVRRLLVNGIMDGPDTLMGGLLALFSSYLLRTCVVFVIGLAGLLAASLESTRDVGFAIGVQQKWLRRGSAVVCVASTLAAGFLLYSRRAWKLHLWGVVGEILEIDVKDVEREYKLRKVDEGKGYESTGPRGLWVAVDGDEVIGRVALNHPVKGDEKIGEVARLYVSSRHRRRGVGRILMDTVIAHARTNGLEGLWLTTTGMNRSAVGMYKKGGWTPEAERTVTLAGITAQAVNFWLKLE